ncbi:Outer membrane porin F precursor [Marinomonas spartinae]|uniref:OmpA family protein n=1 Tax=Marinomonas spartinae TaxID=1792290 RepID=UPI000809087D|nr:OmpA family protein [Marinomonas spartinae]SBS34576.1 Outer membrane porin F precursor [Marinomonas spartinae]
MKIYRFMTLCIITSTFALVQNVFAETGTLTFPKDSTYNNNARLYSSAIQKRLNDQDGDGVIDGRDLCPNTPPRAVVNNDGCSVASTKLLSLDMKVLFDSGKAVVKPPFYPQVKRLADFLRKYPKSHVKIEGYTDNVGNQTYNLNLSQRRASAIANVLVKTFGISPSRVEAIGHGQNNPIASNNTEAGKERNRRVVAEVFAKQKTDRLRWTIYSVDNNQNTAFNTRN